MEERVDPPSSSARLTIKQSAASDEVWVIEDRDLPVACAVLTYQPASLYVGRVAVEPSYRGRGLARALVDAAADVARAHDLHQLELRVRVELTENIAAFGTMGFRKTQEHCHPGFTRTTFITMQKELS